MSRSASYNKMLRSIQEFQHNIALILDAQAFEAARSKHWVCNHLDSSHFMNHYEQVRRTGEIHNQLLEVINGLTRMEQALAKNLQALLTEPEPVAPEAAGGTENFGDMMSLGGTNDASG
ncbi:hypothetical protein ACFQI7_20645 [Paenibacillus allorhizosphaerae]|uniref:Restriction endonuclease subunit S n=1 Tax=Paenibacillus allorhizosphaerae TaxID=2849866 RepID=A0ABN7TMW5_9BACL|nr:hypothetical protein [Paenibacillus allorhizosphaerae]CAG7647792.1 hypothetical protein PAECIP111802_04065 [Paenibacillus allorhizosphaerae]